MTTVPPGLTIRAAFSTTRLGSGTWLPSVCANTKSKAPADRRSYWASPTRAHEKWRVSDKQCIGSLRGNLRKCRIEFAVHTNTEWKDPQSSCPGCGLHDCRPEFAVRIVRVDQHCDHGSPRH